MNKSLRYIIVLVVLQTLGYSAIAQNIKNTPTFHSLAGTALKPQNNVARYVPRTEQLYYWDNNTNLWVFSDSIFYAYDSVGHVTCKTIIRANSPKQRELTSYNAAGDVTEVVYQYFNSSTFVWENFSKNNKVYNAQGVNILDEYFNWHNNAWERYNGYKFTVSYNTINQIVQAVYQSLNHTTQTYADDYRLQFTYESSGQIKEYIQQTRNGTNWDNCYKATNLAWHQWNGTLENSLLRSQIVQSWNGASWADAGYEDIYYDANGGSESFYRVNQNGEWYYYQRISKENDNQRNLIEDKGEVWKETSWSQSYGSKYVLSYNNQLQLSRCITMGYNPVTKQYTNLTKSVYSSFFIVTATENVLSINAVSVYPNPFNSTATLQLGTGVGNQGTFLLFDITGKVVKTQQLTSSAATITRDGLNAGLYFYQVQQNGQKIATGKLNIQ